jgi:serine/threonine-protein kinase
MATITAQNLVETLQRGRILKAAQLEGAATLQQRFPEPNALVAELVRRGWLTAFQAKQLLAGFGQNLVFSSYVLLDRLGEGGSGQVFKARHLSMERIVALKVLRKDLLRDSEAVGRFFREIEVISQLAHPAIVHAYDAGVVGSVYFLAMEYVEGTTLDKLVKDSGRLAVPQACEYIRQAALGLQHAHERGLVHRDIKPGNLLVSGGGASGESEKSDSGSSFSMQSPWGTIKILDLGLARLQQPNWKSNTQQLTVLAGNSVMQGTPDYLAPEQALNFHAADIRADIYSLGCTLYFLLAAEPPFSGGALTQKLMRHQQVEAPRIDKARDDVPAEVVKVLARMLAKQPGDRYQTPGEVAHALTGPAAVGQAPARPRAGPPTVNLSDDETAASGSWAAPPATTHHVSEPWATGAALRQFKMGLLLVGGGVVLFLFLIVALLVLANRPRDDGGSGTFRPVPAPPTEPKPRMVLSFNGTNTLVTMPNDLFRSAPALTVEAWFKTSETGVIVGYQNVAYPGGPGSHVPVIYVGTDGLLRGEFWNGGSRPITSKEKVNDNRWHHACLTAEATPPIQHLYLDGQLLGSLPGKLNHVNMSYNQIGMGHGPGWPMCKAWFGFSGYIAEVRVWHVARSPAEVQSSMNKPLTGKEPGLAAYYPLDETSGDVAVDRSPNGRNAALGGATPETKPARVSVPPFLK